MGVWGGDKGPRGQQEGGRGPVSPGWTAERRTSDLSPKHACGGPAASGSPPAPIWSQLRESHQSPLVACCCQVLQLRPAAAAPHGTSSTVLRGQSIFESALSDQLMFPAACGASASSTTPLCVGRSSRWLARATCSTHTTTFTSGCPAHPGKVRAHARPQPRGGGSWGRFACITS